MTRRTLIGLGVALVLLGLATHRGAPRSPSASGVEVSVEPGGKAVVRTVAAEFVVRPGGCIEARLLATAGPLTLDEATSPEGCSSSITVGGREESGLVLDFDRARIVDLGVAAGGPGRGIEIPGRPAGSGVSAIETKLTLEARDAIPNAVSLTLAYRNAGAIPITLERLALPGRRLAAAGRDAGVAPYALWSFHGSSERVGQDEVVPVTGGLARSNALGLPGRRGVGGGIPVVAFWSASVGTALGHMELLPVALSIPVEAPANGHARARAVLEPQVRLEPGQAFETPRLFHAVFAGDYYEALGIYADLLQSQGSPHHRPSPGSYEPSWCSWGYGEDVTPDRMLGVLPKLHALGLRWAVLDDRWYDAFGDWQPRAETFPGDSIRRVVETYHAHDVKLQLWWVPLAVEMGATLPRGTTQRSAEMGLQHPDWLVLDEAGRPALSTRGLSVFCPAVPEVREYHQRLVQRFIGEWGFDGHKLDAVFTIPRCHNPRHGHRSPDDSLAALGTLYGEILAATRALKADAVVQICPCGTTAHHAWLPFLTQAVAADPWGSAQRRQRIKMYKGFLGPSAAVSGDHSELAENPSTLGGERLLGRDFASTLGTGGVVSTRFVWPQAPPGTEDVLLTPEKEAQWTKWLALDRTIRLSGGAFRNLYLHGFDPPEGYCIEKGGKMYYAFFTADPSDTFDGTLTLRGLGPGRYQVRDYVEGRGLGIVAGESGLLRARFKEYLLLVATTES